MQNFWEERFAGDEYAYGTEPNAFLLNQEKYFKNGGRVLAVADGEGRNGAWLARLGLEVTSVDSSLNGLRKAEKLARSYGKSINTIQANLIDWNWPENEFDFVVSIFLQFSGDFRPLMHEKMIGVLKPGGIIIMQAFAKEHIHYNSGGPKNLAMLYAKEELKKDFEKMKIIRLEENIVELSEGHFHQGKAAVLNLLASQSRV